MGCTNQLALKFIVIYRLVFKTNLDVPVENISWKLKTVSTLLLKTELGMIFETVFALQTKS